LVPDRQDKRSLVPLDLQQWAAWLSGGTDEARSMLRPAAIEIYDQEGGRQ
jgi:putative SOS response-associated peptidase YedK